MTKSEYFCNDCNAGPWSEDEKGSDGKSIVGFHMKLKHVVMAYVEPKLRGVENWGNTEIEKTFTDYMIEHYDEMLHEVIASCKPGKVCLIKDKWQYLYPIGQKFKSGGKL